MKFYTPFIYDKEGNEIAWLVSETPVESLAQLRWQWAHTLKNSKEVFRTPIIETED